MPPSCTISAGRKLTELDRCFVERDIYDGVRGISFGMLRAAGMDVAEIDKLVDQVRVDLLDPHIHTYVPIRCVYGRKPFDGEVVWAAASQDKPVDEGNN